MMEQMSLLGRLTVGGCELGGGASLQNLAPGLGFELALPAGRTPRAAEMSSGYAISHSSLSAPQEA